jgi:hypothetical protein
MTEPLKEGQEKSLSLLNWQRYYGVTHGLALSSICQGQRRRQRIEDLLGEFRFTGEAPAITP